VAGRIGTTRDVSEAVLFLCSPAAAFIHGVVLTVDGGFPTAEIAIDRNWTTPPAEAAVPASA
jgi:NAD(P)-dependent dehydrogenase (short-subunit alcohol dehydrogenase family)